MFAGEFGPNHPVLQLMSTHFDKYFPKESDMQKALLGLVITGGK
jgi:hypothetical protein